MILDFPVVYRCKHFEIYELVTPDIFSARGDAAWELLDPRLLITVDAVRERFGRTIINNWKSGGQYHESGLRVFGTSTGAKLSQHFFGRAADCKLDIAPADACAYILSHRDEFPYLTTMENTTATPTWLHVDVRNNATPDIRIVNP
jgi:hypothetical protein